MIQASQYAMISPALKAALPSFAKTSIPTPVAVAETTTTAHKAITLTPFALMVGAFLLHYYAGKTLDKILG